MAKRARFKPSAKAICNLGVASGDSIHSSDMPPRMRPWLLKHGHVTHSGYRYYLTRKGKRMIDKACNVDFGFTASGGKRRGKR